MDKKDSVLLRGLASGCISGMLVFLLAELSTSIYTAEYFSQCIVIAAICAVLSFLMFYFLLRKENFIRKMLAFFGLDQLFFVITLFLIFVNYMSLHIGIMPQRELSYGDGILLMLVFGTYLIVSESLRLITVLGKICINLFEKKNVH